MSLESNSSEQALARLRADNTLEVVPYHCLLSDLNDMDDYDFLHRLQKSFNIRVARDAADASPAAEREFGVYLAGCWYHMTAIAGTWFFKDPVKDLDISILRDNMLSPLLGINITDKNSNRINYVKGQPRVNSTQNLQALKDLVDTECYQAAIVLFPPSTRRIADIAAQGKVMPMLCFEIENG